MKQLRHSYSLTIKKSDKDVMDQFKSICYLQDIHYSDMILKICKKYMNTERRRLENDTLE